MTFAFMYAFMPFFSWCFDFLGGAQKTFSRVSLGQKCPESGKEKNRKSGIRTFENSRTTGTGRDVRLSPSDMARCFMIQLII